MSNIDQLMNKDVGGMPYVRFERTAIEDVAATRDAGHYVAKDVDVAHITPPYSKDIIKHKVVNWFTKLEGDVRNERIPREWVDKYKAAYAAWQKGQELPLDGFPIRGWGVCSPAQQETLIKLHILTVEQLAAANDEGIRRIGMGGIDLKNKAEAWLKQLSKAGKPTIEIAALKKENESLSNSVASLEKRISELTNLVEQSGILKQAPMTAAINASDLMDD